MSKFKTIEELTLSKISKLSSVSFPSRHQFKLHDYYERLRKGESMNEILKSASQEERSYISKHFDVSKVVQNEHSKDRVLELIRAGSSVEKIVSEVDGTLLAFIIENLQTIQNLQNILFDARGSTKDVESRQIRNSQALSSNQAPLFPGSHQQVNSSKITSSPTTSYSCTSQNTTQNICGSYRINYHQEYGNGEEDSDNEDDDDDDYVITFGSKVNGMTFKEVLINYKQYESWLRWLKFEWHKATSDPECAKKAYNYFSKRVPNWNQLKSFTRN